MDVLPCKRQLGCAALLGALALLPSCGGGNGPADAVGEELGCSLLNCKDSATLATADISPRLVASQDGGEVRIDASVSYRANLLTQVKLTGGDQLAAAAGNQRVALVTREPIGSSAQATFGGQPAGATVTLEFVRGGVVYPSTVKIPAPFTVKSPQGAIAILRSPGQYFITLD
jgi:hypothetical protein